jgi:uncharacterized membrane protein YidH (DUF202 family)
MFNPLTLIAGIGATLVALSLATWLDKRFGAHIKDKRPWVVPVLIIISLLVVIGAVYGYRALPNTL